MTKDLILSIDNGTQSVRALIFDLKGNLLYKKRVPLTPYVSRQPGWAEQDARYYWESLGRACQMLWSETSVPKEAIAGVALTTQRATMINLDKEGKFIPFCTKMVFLKYYTPSDHSQLHFWGQSDRIAYVRAINKTLKNYLPAENTVEQEAE